LRKINLGFYGRIKIRHPYNLGKHSNSNKNFGIHIFALLTFQKNPGCYTLAINNVAQKEEAT
jgi:hypothetical protein